MNSTEKQSFIRLLLDLIKADKIIALEEISKMKEVCAKYNIDRYDIENSLNVSLSEACKCLSNSRRSLRRDLLKVLKDTTIADGACSREEALLLIAIKYCLDNNTRQRCRIISHPSQNIDFEDSQVLYLEKRMDNTTNAFIKNNYFNIINAMRVGGFDFVYIPKIAEHYRNTDEELISNIIEYLSPTLSRQETIRVNKTISNMTTRYFKNEILKEKLGLQLDLRRPSLMIKIGNSHVKGDKYSDFLLIELASDILSEITAFVELFLEYQRSPLISIRNFADIKGNFVYTGFYKTIFDLITYRKGARSQIVIDPMHRNGQLLIENTDSEYMKLNSSQTALYVFLICESLSSRKGVRFVGRGRTSLDEIQERFEKIYRKFSSRESAPKIIDETTRNPLMSHIRSKIEACKVLTEKNMYIPKSDTEGNIFVDIDEHLVFVQNGNTKTPIRECEQWESLLQ